jgi:DNA sulfur modification protein DndB
MPKITARATEWFEAVTDTLRAPLEDRKNCLTSSPAVFAAIGAMGHELVAIDDDTARTARRKRLIDDLKTIKWQKDQRWDGIAGKLTPKGRFAVAGSKEVAYAVYRALTDSSDEGYARVRGQKSHASAATG